jgi:hypothetical protein
MAVFIYYRLAHKVLHLSNTFIKCAILKEPNLYVGWGITVFFTFGIFTFMWVE